MKCRKIVMFVFLIFYFFNRIMGCDSIMVYDFIIDYIKEKNLE